jgi:hypothetical protein
LYSFSDEDYRFGFNGVEKDDDLFEGALPIPSEFPKSLSQYWDLIGYQPVAFMGFG